MLPSSPAGRGRYWDRDPEWRIIYPKATQIGHSELDPITPQGLACRDGKQQNALRADSFWADQMENALYFPAECDTPVNFVVMYAAKMVILYRVAAPMAWEYPYAFGQAHKSVQDRLGTASMYGMRLVRTGYTGPQAQLEVPAAAEAPAVKQAACVAYVIDADVSYTQEMDCTIIHTPGGRVAFTCPEEQCGVADDMPCYFATVEQWITHWNTFHVAPQSSRVWLVGAQLSSIVGWTLLMPF